MKTVVDCIYDLWAMVARCCATALVIFIIPSCDDSFAGA